MITGQFSDAFLPVMDGVSITVYNYALWLNKKIGPSYVVTHGFPKYDEQDDVPVLRYISIPVPGKPPYRLGLPHIGLSVQQQLRKLDFDLLHAHSPFTLGRLALRMARRRDIPVVATFHSKFRDDFETHIPFPSVIDWGINWIVDFFDKADEVWVPNGMTGETLKAYGYRGKYEIVQNGIDLNGSAAGDSLRKDGQNLLGVGEEDFVFLFVGQHSLVKNVEFLIQSLGRLKSLGKLFKMVFVGEGYARRKMETMVEKLGLADNTCFTGVVRDRDRLMAYYARADLFLFPSLYDNAPLTVREAASFQVAAVLLENSNAAENMKDGVNGFLAENSVDAYAEKLSFLMENPRIVRKVGKKAKKTLSRSWEEIVDEVKDRYISLINRRKGI
jgi:glycosyltransferase involved in cell wall biosynthesis